MINSNFLQNQDDIRDKLERAGVFSPRYIDMLCRQQAIAGKQMELFERVVRPNLHRIHASLEAHRDLYQRSGANDDRRFHS